MLTTTAANSGRPTSSMYHRQFSLGSRRRWMMGILMHIYATFRINQTHAADAPYLWVSRSISGVSSSTETTLTAKANRVQPWANSAHKEHTSDR